MSERERAYQLLDEIPDNKIPYLVGYMQGSFLTKVIRKVTPFLRKTGLYGFAGKMYKTLLVRKK